MGTITNRLRTAAQHASLKILLTHFSATNSLSTYQRSAKPSYYLHSIPLVNLGTADVCRWILPFEAGETRLQICI